MPRDLSQFAVGQGKFVGLGDHQGTLINDPILLNLDDDRCWLPIADPDMLLWSRAIASVRDFSVDIVERLVKDFPNQIVGVKDSTYNLYEKIKINNFSIFPGSETKLLRGL